ncbi:hypothetical protein ONZ45_g11791 [Pleurotus djamor]|nr:hypothetical protein ONZ45_g11791 [Pleurotus djamor]
MESPDLVSRLHLEEPHTFDRLHAMLKDYAKEKEAAESEKSIAMKRWDSAAEQNGTLDRQFVPMMRHLSEDKSTAFEEIIAAVLSMVQAKGGDENQDSHPQTPLPTFPKQDLTEAVVHAYRSENPNMIASSDVEKLKLLGEMSKIILKDEIQVLVRIRRKFDEELDYLRMTARRKNKEATELEVRSRYKRLCLKGELNFDKEKKRLEGLSRKLPSGGPATATEATSSSGSASKASSTDQATSSSANADADRKRKTRDDLADGSDKKKRKKVQTKSIRDRPTKGPSDGVRGGGVS